MDYSGVEDVAQPGSAPFGGRDRAVRPRVLARYRVHVEQFSAPVAGADQGRHHRVGGELAGQLVVGDIERRADRAVDGQSPLLGRDVGERAVVAAVKGIQRGDLAIGQHRSGWLSVERHPATHNHVGALTPHLVGPLDSIQLICQLRHLGRLRVGWLCL